MFANVFNIIDWFIANSTIGIHLIILRWIFDSCGGVNLLCFSVVFDGRFFFLFTFSFTVFLSVAFYTNEIFLLLFTWEIFLSEFFNLFFSLADIVNFSVSDDPIPVRLKMLWFHCFRYERDNQGSHSDKWFFQRCIHFMFFNFSHSHFSEAKIYRFGHQRYQ